MSKTKYALGYALVLALTASAAADILPPRPQPPPDESRLTQPSTDQKTPAAPSTEEKRPVPPPSKGEDTANQLVRPGGRSTIAIAVGVGIGISFMLIFSGGFRRRRSPPAAT